MTIMHHSREMDMIFRTFFSRPATQDMFDSLHFLGFAMIVSLFLGALTRIILYKGLSK